MNSPFVLSFKADAHENKVSVEQPILGAVGEWIKKLIIGVRRENCKGRGMAVVYSRYKKVDQCK
jgi:hypothetical protein